MRGIEQAVCSERKCPLKVEGEVAPADVTEGGMTHQRERWVWKALLTAASGQVSETSISWEITENQGKIQEQRLLKGIRKRQGFDSLSGHDSGARKLRAGRTFELFLFRGS